VIPALPYFYFIIFIYSLNSKQNGKDQNDGK
jgi:hypothetical protein